MKFEEIELQYHNESLFSRIKNVFNVDKESSDISPSNNI